MRELLCAVVLALPVTAQADEHHWTPLTGVQITQALTDRVLQYDNGWQDFRASGRTLYNAGHDSWGYWRVDAERYCSMWPPSDLWACHKVERDGNRLRFSGTSKDDVTEATYKDLPR